MSDKKNEAKAKVSEVIRKIIEQDPEYFLDGKFVRWGKVEKDIHSIVDGCFGEAKPDLPELTLAGLIQFEREFFAGKYPHLRFGQALCGQFNIEDPSNKIYYESDRVSQTMAWEYLGSKS